MRARSSAASAGSPDRIALANTLSDDVSMTNEVDDCEELATTILLLHCVELVGHDL
jgi:hypothetical protein